jgi:hypothetical protein
LSGIGEDGYAVSAMATDRPTWPPNRPEIVAYGSIALFVAGLVIIGVGLAHLRVWIIVVGVVAVALPLLRWFRVRIKPGEGLDFEGEMEKLPNGVSDSSEQESARTRRHSA